MDQGLQVEKSKCPECEPFRKSHPNHPADPGRNYELCTGTAYSDRSMPTLKSANAFRVSHGLDPLPARTSGSGGFSGTVRMGDIGGGAATTSDRPRLPPRPRAQVGSAVESLLKSLGITSKLKPEKAPDGAVCKPCSTMKARLNNLPLEVVREKADEFADELRGRAAGDYSLWDWGKAAAAAVASGLAFRLNPLDPFPGLIEQACRMEESRIEQAEAAVAAAETVEPTEGK